MNVDPTAYWRGVVATAQTDDLNNIEVLTVDLARIVAAWGHARNRCIHLEAEVQRLNQIVRQHRRS